MKDAQKLVVSSVLLCVLLGFHRGAAQDEYAVGEWAAELKEKHVNRTIVRETR